MLFIQRKSDFFTGTLSNKRIGFKDGISRDPVVPFTAQVEQVLFKNLEGDAASDGKRRFVSGGEISLDTRFKMISFHTVWKP